MKTTILALLGIAAITGSAIAGPFRTLILKDNGPGDVIQIPSGRALSIVNAIPGSSSGGAVVIRAISGTSKAILLFIPQTPPNVGQDVVMRDITVDGPAQLEILVGTGQTCVLTYKIFAN